MRVGTQAQGHVHVALLFRHATRMHHTVTSFVAPSLQHIFRHYFISNAIFGKKVTEYKMFVFILSITFVYTISHSKNNFARQWHKRENVFM